MNITINHYEPGATQPALPTPSLLTSAQETKP
jgi:hypothetical protein